MWQRYVPDDTHNFLPCRNSIIQSNDGINHLVAGGDKLYHYYDNGNGINWHTETIDNQPGVGQRAQIAEGSDGTLHIAYNVPHINDYGDHKDITRIVSGKQGHWQVQNVPPLYGYIDSFKLDGSNAYHIVHGYTAHSYATNRGGTWQDEYITDFTSDDHFGGMAVETDGTPHLCVFNDMNKTYRHYWRDNSTGWHYEKIIDAPNQIYFSLCDIEVDSSGTLHTFISIPKNDYTNEKELVYLKKTGTGWISSTVIASIDSNVAPDLAVDTDGTKWSACFNVYDNNHIKLGCIQSNSTSIIEYVSPQNPYSHTFPFAITRDAQRKTHLYLLQDNGEIRYADNTPSDHWLTRNGIDRKGKTEVGALAYDKEENLHLLYRERYTNTLRYVMKPKNGHFTEHETVDTNLPLYDNFVQPDIDVSDDGTVHICYGGSTTDGGNRLIYAFRKNGQWQSSDIDTNTSRCTIRAQKSANAFIAYYKKAIPIEVKLIDTDPDHAPASGTYRTVTVESGLDGVGAPVTIDISTDNTPHLLYENVEYSLIMPGATTHTLKHATVTQDGTVNIETVEQWENDGDSTGNFSIAVDKHGITHISYFRHDSNTDNNKTVRYATNANGSWQTKQIFSFAKNNHLGIDMSGEVHLCYERLYNFANPGALICAHLQNGAHTDETVSSHNTFNDMTVSERGSIAVSQDAFEERDVAVYEKHGNKGLGMLPAIITYLLD